MEREERWKQLNPRDQSIVILSNIEGTILNCVDGCFDLDQLENKVQPMIDELRRLHRWLPERW